MQEIINKFTTHLKNALTRALTFVVEHEQGLVEPRHLLWALASQKGSIGAEILSKAKVKLEEVRELLLLDANPMISAAKADAPSLSEEARRIVEKAVLIASNNEHRYVGTEHLLSALLQVANAEVNTFFIDQQIDLQGMHAQLEVVLKSTSRFPELTRELHSSSSTQTSTKTNQPKETPKTEDDQKTPALDYFGYELTTVEAQQEIDPVIGREQEIERVLQILCRRSKNNPILLGEPGVGKTAIVEGLAKKILEGNVPPEMRHKRIFALDLSMMIAGTMYRGEFEGRLKQIVEETSRHPEIILFIDEVHMIVGAGSASGSLDAANMLKPALARGEIRCIGATTPAEYKKQFETDAALERRFCPVQVEEPNVEKTIQILKGVKKGYEDYHHVIISEEALEAAVNLSHRYVQDKRQPDKSLDLIDEAAAGLRLRKTIAVPKSTQTTREERLQQWQEEKQRAIKEERYADAAQIKEQEQLLRASVIPEEKAAVNYGTVGEEEVAEVIARTTGIPLTELLSEERRFKKLESALTARVLGQETAVKTVARALRRARAGVTDPRRPLASFLFLGPSGVGKTELARAIAQEVFQDESALITLDMSEFAEGFSVSKLVGAPAGYVGYREPTKLTDRVKQKPYAVVLFDEMEKAHKDVLNLLLQILENGTLTDATGRQINFKQTILVMTSNAGADKWERGEIGFGGSADRSRLQMTSEMRKDLEEQFRPELLNRIDQLCLFQPLGKETITAITDKLLQELVARLKNKEINVTVDAAVAPHLSAQAELRLGARDARRLVSEQVETAIADALLGAKKDLPLRVFLEKQKLVVKTSA